MQIIFFLSGVIFALLLEVSGDQGQCFKVSVRARHEISVAHTELTLPGANDSYSLFPWQQGSCTHQEMIMSYYGYHILRASYITEPIRAKSNHTIRE